MSESDLDVLVIGEPLAELASDGPLVAGATLEMSFSGDALNVASAAASAGAHVALLARVGDDELGQAMVAHMARLGIDTELVRLVAGENGLYLTTPGSRERKAYVYARAGSAASRLSPPDVVLAAKRATVVVASGVTCALSAAAREAVEAAARLARMFVYDPNFRSRLTSADDARSTLMRLLPQCALVVPSCPDETLALLGTRDPWEAADRCLQAGAEAAAITAGADGVFLAGGDQRLHLRAIVAQPIRDETGAGDWFLGTVAARLAAGDALAGAAELGTAAASLKLGAAGGDPRPSTLEQTRAHLRRARSGSRARG